jgi:hypothetical protein
MKRSPGPLSDLLMGSPLIHPLKRGEKDFLVECQRRLNNKDMGKYQSEGLAYHFLCLYQVFKNFLWKIFCIDYGHKNGYIIVISLKSTVDPEDHFEVTV